MFRLNTQCQPINHMAWTKENAIFELTMTTVFMDQNTKQLKYYHLKLNYYEK